MKLVIFGLTVSSSWGNGHATLWRGLIRAFERRGHDVVFFERDQPWYAGHRDLWDLSPSRLVLYGDWEAVRTEARRAVEDADVAIVTSFCPDGVAACRLVIEHAPAHRVFYDMDTPVTLAHLEAGETVTWLPPEGLGDFDLVLSYTGGDALDALRARLSARRVAPLYGHVDPEVHVPSEPDPAFAADLSYLGTYAADRQATLDALLLSPARHLPHRRFVVGGSMYPPTVRWPDNVRHVEHVAPQRHPAFYASAPLTLSVTRAAMARSGWCPSGRLFEAAACGTPVLSDPWPGLEAFFVPGEEILVARDTAEAVDALLLDRRELAAIGRRARARVLADHTSEARARELLALVEERVPALAGG